MKRILVGLFAILLLILMTVPVDASSQGSDEIYFKPEQIINFSKKVEKSLAQKGARVAVIARVGRPRDQLPPGFGYTHVAFAVYSQITTKDNRQIPGYAMRNLYQRDKEPAVSDLIQDFPVDFFSGVQVLEAGIIIPSPELQKRLLEVIASPTYKELHNPRYSLIANPFTVEYQNCTEHTLDVIFAAIYQTNDIRKIKKNEEVYFEAQPVNVGPLRLLFGSIFSAEVATSDHPRAPVTATFETMIKFLQKYDSGCETYVIMADEPTKGQIASNP
jgi:hypothetical protein